MPGQLLPAGVETYNRSLGGLLLGLLSDPAQLDAIRADRSLIPQAMEECSGILRCSPSPGWQPATRTRGKQDNSHTVMPMLGAASRQRTASGARPQCTRQPRKCPLSPGLHVCLRMHLARPEMRTAINLLLDRLPNLRLDPRPTTRTSGGRFSARDLGAGAVRSPIETPETCSLFARRPSASTPDAQVANGDFR